MLSRASGSEQRPQVWGSEQAGGWLFAIIGTSGYLLGEFIGGREFHLRLIRLAVLVMALAAINFAILYAMPAST